MAKRVRVESSCDKRVEVLRVRVQFDATTSLMPSHYCETKLSLGTCIYSNDISIVSVSVFRKTFTRVRT
jgi:hypothetical protein